jgi:hypothetical protein
MYLTNDGIEGKACTRNTDSDSERSTKSECEEGGDQEADTRRKG